MKKIVIFISSLFISCLFVSGLSYADEPPDWQAFLIHSRNNQWTAVVDRNGSSQNAAEDQWHVSVFNQQLLSIPKPSSSLSPQWIVPFYPIGYAGGLISDDGEVVAFVDQWYSADKPMVTIYRKDCHYKKPGSAFRFSKDFPKTESHQLWLTENSEPQFVNIENKLFVKLDTLEGKRFISVNCERELQTN